MKPEAASPEAPVLLRDDLAGGIAVLRLNRPAARNALSEALIEALSAALDRLATERATRVIVIAAAGPAFCAGHDLKEMTARRTDADRGRAYFAELMGRCAAMMTRLVRSPKPVIAAVEGVASAAGCQLVASCDLAIAGEGARFATPGVDIGLFCSTPMVALTRNVARKHAMAMLLTGDMVDAEAAARIGLVNQVVVAGRAEAEAIGLAKKIAGKSSKVLRIGKEAFHRQIEMGLDEAYAYTAGIMVENMLAAEAEEGIGAFVERRKPRWE